MNSDTLKALEGSIEKWQNIVDDKGMDLGGSNCALCQRFTGNDLHPCVVHENEEDAEQCPVSLEVNDASCDNTPYSNWIKHRGDDACNYETRHIIGVSKCDICTQLATEELEFLKSLRP